MQEVKIKIPKNVKEVRRLKQTFSVEFTFLDLVILEDLVSYEICRMSKNGESALYEKELLERIMSILNKS